MEGMERVKGRDRRIISLNLKEKVPSTTLHSPLPLHFTSPYPTRKLRSLAPFLCFRVIPFHWAVTARPSLPKLNKRSERPTVADAGSELSARDADALFIN